MRPARARENGAADVQFYGSTLPVEALRLLASLTPEELRAIASMLATSCPYGKGESARISGVAKILRAAEVCP